MNDAELAAVANEVRKGVLTGVHAAKSGHPGGSLGAADIITYLYFEEMNVDPADPRKADRDRFVLSKGHCAPALYAALAERGYFPKEELATLRHIGSRLQGHPNMNDTPGVDMSTGSLGQGISAAVGMALAAKHWHEDYRTYALLGDGDYWLRPPWGFLAPQTAAAVEVPMVYWSLDTEDWRRLDADAVAQDIIDHARDGDIILLHDPYATSVEAALRAIDALTPQGYRFVTLEELFRQKGVEPEPGKLYIRPDERKRIA